MRSSALVPATTEPPLCVVVELNMAKYLDALKPIILSALETHREYQVTHCMPACLHSFVHSIAVLPGMCRLGGYCR